MAKSTILNNVDKDKLNSLLDATDKNTEYFNSIVENVSNAYSETLDKIMKDLYLKQRELKLIPLDELEQYLLKLTNTIYFMGDKLEQLGIHNDLSKAARQEVYNNAYIDSQTLDSDKKLTVAELSAKSEEASKYECVVNSLYDRAYRIFKFKIDAAQEMVNTLRKIISRRLAEMDLSKFQSNNFCGIGDA